VRAELVSNRHRGYRIERRVLPWTNPTALAGCQCVDFSGKNRVEIKRWQTNQRPWRACPPASGSCTGFVAGLSTAGLSMMIGLSMAGLSMMIGLLMAGLSITARQADACC
jgi:hypothetical protein